MEKKYIFHYDKMKPPWRKNILDMMIAHDGMICSTDIEDFGALDLVYISFDDGTGLNAFVYELEEVNGS